MVVLYLIIVGAAAGYLATRVMRLEANVLTTVAIGILGAIIGGLTKVAKDVIPYGLVDAGSGRLDGLNLIGLKRKGVPRAEIAALRAAYASLAEGDGTFQDRARALAETTSSDFVRELANFILSDSDRHFLTPGA